MLYQDHNGSSNGTYVTNQQPGQNEDNDRLRNIVSRDGATEDGEQRNGLLKRGSTQATYDGNFNPASK